MRLVRYNIRQVGIEYYSTSSDPLALRSLMMTSHEVSATMRSQGRLIAHCYISHKSDDSY